MAENENTSNNLSDEQLDEVSGGFFNTGIVEVKDTRGRVVGQYFYGVLQYWPCPNCGRPTHDGAFKLYCDKCDGDWWSLDVKKWPGTEDELKAAGAAN